MRHHRKLNIISTIMPGIFMVAILIGCSNSNRPSAENPSNTQSPALTSAPPQSPEGTPDPLKTQGMVPADEAHGGIQPSLPEEPSPSAAHEPGGEIMEQEKTNLPYYKEENAERYDQYQAENPDMAFEQVVVYVNIGLDREFYEGIRPAVNTGSLSVLVNKFNKLPDDFKPELTKLPESLCVSGVGEQFLRKEAAEALLKMSEDAKREGLSILAYGAYRSISTQNNIWNKAINSGRAQEDVDSLNARGGHSEHHTGLAVDVIRNNYSVADTPEYEWYKDKAHEYGFIIRYPEGKEHITGYKYEPWHLRYVGPEIAAVVYESGLTYEEYYVTNLP